jgi:arylsulfatase A-like enzyme
MRAVNVMFDTLCRNFLSNYGNSWIQTPNFQRLNEKCCKFDHFYGGSMPCMPARRELHTGRYNFMHRSWGPLEPFDYSVYETLNKHGIYTHLVTDHSHYLEDGGGTYHNRYSTWELFRGQEGDRWVPQSYGTVPEGRSVLNKKGSVSILQHYANVTRQENEEDMSCVKTFHAGENFIKRHVDKDQWYLQIESFDPHEPFYVPDRYRHLYDLKGPQKLDWPAYGPVDSEKNQQELDEMRREYASLVTMCDHYLGEVLDLFDQYDLWKDTMLIVNTDHGFLLGEHDLLGKNFPPMYEELIHLPFFIHVPGGRYTGERNALSQTVDIPATLLDYFHIPNDEDMDGHSLRSVIEKDQSIRPYACFGVHGSSFGITDGHRTYFRASNPENEPFVECTLMPTNMRGYFPSDALKRASLYKGDRFSHNIPYLKVPSKTYMNSSIFGNLLFDLDQDPKEETNLLPNDELEKQFLAAICEIMHHCDAPEEEYQRLGL